MATDDLKALDILEAEIDRVMNAAPHSDYVRIPLQVAAKCRAAIATAATLEAQLAARDAALGKLDEEMRRYVYDTDPKRRLWALDKFGPTAIASGDYTKGQTDAQQGD